MIPDYDRAATAAAEILVKYSVSTAPVDPIPIFKRAPGFNVVTFTEMSGMIGMDRHELISTFEVESHDAVTCAYMKNGSPQIEIGRASCRERV